MLLTAGKIMLIEVLLVVLVPSVMLSPEELTTYDIGAIIISVLLLSYDNGYNVKTHYVYAYRNLQL